MKKNRKWPMRVLLLLAVAILGVSGWLLYADYRALRQSGEQADLKPEPVDGSRLLDFGALLAQYPDITGWLTIDGTVIDYPVVQAADNQYYLTHTADNQVNKLGALFMDYRCSRDFSGFNTVIYGHYLRSGAMFADLHKFKERDYFDTHRTGTLYTPDGTWPLEIFAFVLADSYSEFYDYAFDSPGRCQAHLDRIAAKATFYQEFVATCEDRILTLSTCSYEYKTARALVIAKIVE